MLANILPLLVSQFACKLNSHATYHDVLSLNLGLFLSQLLALQFQAEKKETRGRG